MKIFAPILLLFLCSCGVTHKAVLTVEKNSGHKIKNISVELSNQKRNKPTLKASDNTYEFSFTNYSDDHFILNIEFSSGYSAGMSFGYITHSMSFSEKVVLNGKEASSWVHTSPVSD
jgi:hypothetical protein